LYDPQLGSNVLSVNVSINIRCLWHPSRTSFRPLKLRLTAPSGLTDETTRSSSVTRPTAPSGRTRNMAQKKASENRGFYVYQYGLKGKLLLNHFTNNTFAVCCLEGNEVNASRKFCSFNCSNSVSANIHNNLT